MTKTIRVAVCDDARAVKFFLRTVLEEEGDMQVVSTSSGGQEALRALAEHEADILLLDLLLPDVPEPADLVREIRERWPSTAILLMSNLPPSQLEKEAERLGHRRLDAEGAQARAAAPVGARHHRRAGVALGAGAAARRSYWIASSARSSPSRPSWKSSIAASTRATSVVGIAGARGRALQARLAEALAVAGRVGRAVGVEQQRLAGARARSGGPTSSRSRSRPARAPRSRRGAPRRRGRRAAAAGGRPRRARCSLRSYVALRFALQSLRAPSPRPARR